MKPKASLTNLSEFIDKKYGAPGFREREEFEAGYGTFKLGVLLQQARLAKELTQALQTGASLGAAVTRD